MQIRIRKATKQDIDQMITVYEASFSVAMEEDGLDISDGEEVAQAALR